MGSGLDQDERFGETTTIVVEPARTSGSTVAPSRRELTKRLRAERMLRWHCMLGMTVFAVVWLTGMLLLAWLVPMGLLYRIGISSVSLVSAVLAPVPSLVYAIRR